MNRSWACTTLPRNPQPSVDVLLSTLALLAESSSMGYLAFSGHLARELQVGLYHPALGTLDIGRNYLLMQNPFSI